MLKVKRCDIFMRCQNCGTQNRDGLNYCVNCGQLLEKEIEEIIEVKEPRKDNVIDRKQGIIIVLLLITPMIMFVILLAALYFIGLMD